MTSITDLKIKHQIFSCFLPENLIEKITPVLKEFQIPYNVKTGNIIVPEYKKYIKQAESKYKNAGYTKDTNIGILNVPFHPDSFFKFTKQFF